MDFSEKQIEILEQVAIEVDEVLVETRKNKPQSFYVFEVKEDAEYFNDTSCEMEAVPEDLVGFWKMAYLDDLSYYSLKEAFGRYSWRKTFKKEIVTYEWADS